MQRFILKWGTYQSVDRLPRQGSVTCRMNGSRRKFVLRTTPCGVLFQTRPDTNILFKASYFTHRSQARIHKVRTPSESWRKMEKNEQNNEIIKWSKISIRAVLKFISVCTKMFAHFIFSFCSFLSIQTLIKRTYFMNETTIFDLHVTWQQQTLPTNSYKLARGVPSTASSSTLLKMTNRCMCGNSAKNRRNTGNSN